MVVDVKKLMGRVDCLQQNHWNMDYNGAVKPLKGKEENNWNSFPNPQTAFLGPQLWEKKISMTNVDQDLKSWQGYRGWNEVQQNCQNIGSYEEQQQQHIQAMQQGFHTLHQQQIQEWAFNQPKLEPAKMMDNSLQSHHSISSNPSPPCRMETKNDDVEFKVSDDDLALAIVPGAQFDPKTRSFSAEELKPQPIIRKRAKHFTADGDKDERYWQKRSKNNVAARRSREARRLKENQIALRAAYLEKQNTHLKITLKRLNIENAHIKVNVDHLLARIVEKQKSMEAERINNINNNLINNINNNNNQINNNSNNCSSPNQLPMEI